MLSEKLTVLVVLAVFATAAGLWAGETNTHASVVKPVAEVLGKSIHASQKVYAGMIIFGALLDEYAATNNITVTDGEVAVYLKEAEIKFARDKAALEKEKNGLKVKLDAPILPAKDRTMAEEQIRQINGAISVIDGLMAPERRESRARSAIKMWKIGKSLHARYGGRVISRDNEPEPYEAYVAFLRDKEKEGAFQINDPQITALFWGSFTNAEKLSNWIVPEQESARAMNSPWWLQKHP